MNRREFLLGGLCAVAGGCRLFTRSSRDFDESLTVFISDVHVHPGGHQVPRLQAVVADILRLDPLPRRVVCFGDLAYLFGKVEDYRTSRPLLEPLRAAGIELVFGHGNHDRRAEFFEVWPEYAGKSPVRDRLVSETDLGPCDLVMLDTLWQQPDPKARWITEGQLTGEQMDWLMAEFKRRTRPFFLCAHHPVAEIVDGKSKEINDALMAAPACVGWIHGHDHVWRPGLLAPSKRKWGDNTFKRLLCLPSTGHWGDIGFVCARTTPTSLRAELVIKDHFFPKPEKRVAADDDYVAEKRGAFMTFRWGA